LGESLDKFGLPSGGVILKVSPEGSITKKPCFIDASGRFYSGLVLILLLALGVCHGKTPWQQHFILTHFWTNLAKRA
jgi:hypothetical protein